MRCSLLLLGTVSIGPLVVSLATETQAIPERQVALFKHELLFPEVDDVPTLLISD